MAEEKRTSSRTVFVQPTTGGQIEIKVSEDTTVTTLKKTVATKLKVPKDRIVLLHQNKQLVDGTMVDNHILDGAKLTLLPSVEAGLSALKPEQCVMQALETLNDTQVDSFLAGRSPLNLSMRLGDHMMFIQLQLSTVSSNSTAIPTPPTTPTSPTSPSNLLQFPTPSTVQATTTAPLSPPPSPKPAPPPAEDNTPRLNAKALAEASKNLTQTLRQLSTAAFSKKMNESCDGRCISRRHGGAVIESMFHHGRGVYSGTFSGTLSPSLQDKDGRPRRDISTIIHILNDLLGASSHCRPSAQCLCSQGNTNTTSTANTSNCSSANKTTGLSQPSGQTVNPSSVSKGQEKQEENQVLRQKVEQIQSMLEERRQKRRARRTVRSSPYSTCSSKASNKAGICTNSSDKMADYSSAIA